MSDLGPDAKNLLELARDGDDLSPSAKARHKRDILARAAIGAAAGTSAALATKSAAATGTAATTVTTATSMALVPKVLGTLAIVGAIAGGTMGVRAITRSASTTSTSPSAFGGPVAPPATSTPTPTPTSTSTSTSPEIEARAPVAVAPPPRVAPTPKPQSIVVAPAPAPLPSSTALENETRLLRTANDALQSGDASRALSLLDDHARTYPNGLLAEERSAQRVFALCALGRTDDARAEAQRFLRARPNSPLAPRVRASCGGP